MVFKRGVALLAIAATAALVSVEAAPIQVHTDLKNPVVKSVKSDHGKLVLTLQEGSTVKKAAPKHAKHHEEKKKHHAVKHTDVKKIDVKKPAAVKVQAKKDQNKKHPAAKKSVAKKTAPKVETKADGEIIKRYAHGEVRVIAKNQPAAKTDAHKKHAKKVAKKQVEETVDDSADESADVDLKVGEAVTIEFAGHTVYLEALVNGSVSLTSDSVTQILPPAESIELEIEETDSEDSEETSSTAGSGSHSSPPTEVGLLEQVEDEASIVAKKFTELATKLTGDGKFFSKEAAPVIFIGGCIGALAAIVGIAAIAIGRSRDNAAAADPSSVLADATEDVEADVEAGVTSTTEEESSEDAAADETQSLSSSDSESDAEEDSEEGKFTNEVASV